MPTSALITVIICSAIVAICLIHMIGDVIKTVNGYYTPENEEDDDDYID